MDTTLYTDCPVCGALMSQECDWSKKTFAQPPPRFHSQRVVAAGMADAPNVVDGMSKESLDRAFQNALDAL